MSMMNPDRVAATLDDAVMDMIGRGDMDMGERLAAGLVTEIATGIRFREVPPTTAGALVWLEDCLTRAVDDNVEETA